VACAGLILLQQLQAKAQLFVYLVFNGAIWGGQQIFELGDSLIDVLVAFIHDAGKTEKLKLDHLIGRTDAEQLVEECYGFASFLFDYFLEDVGSDAMKTGHDAHGVIVEGYLIVGIDLTSPLVVFYCLL
jgi:hypothetical protein